MSSSNCCFLTFIQISQEADQVVWYSHVFRNFPQFMVIHTVDGFGIVNKAEVDVFLELSCFFHDSTDGGNLISGSSAFSKSSLNIWNFSVHILLKPSLENFECYFTSMWNECNCIVFGTFLGPAFFGIVMKAYQHHILGFEIPSWCSNWFMISSMSTWLGVKSLAPCFSVWRSPASVAFRWI